MEMLNLTFPAKSVLHILALTQPVPAVVKGFLLHVISACVPGSKHKAPAAPTNCCCSSPATVLGIDSHV